MTGRAVSKSPAPPGGRRSSRHSTPTRITSPPPSTRSTRSSGAHLVEPNAGTPSLAPPVPTASASGGLAIPKSPSRRALSPRASARPQRPALPIKHINRFMNPAGGTEGAAAKEKKLYRVKTQILDLGEGSGHIGIARVKVPVPKGVPGYVAVECSDPHAAVARREPRLVLSILTSDIASVFFAIDGLRTRGTTVADD